jgi:hypothetical protein
VGFNCGAGLLLIVLLSGEMAAGRVGEKGAQIRVLVSNSVRMSGSVLNHAEEEAARIFRTAGIDIVWVNCPGGFVLASDACRHVPGFNEFVMHIVANGRTSSGLVFGVSFLDSDGAGKYSDVFYDRVEEAHRKSGEDISQLLGTVAAHELGHLLLGTNAHSCSGIMAPVWKKDILRQMEMGNLLFSSEQASRMRARIGDRGIRMASVGASASK